ncbi:MAG: sodium/solute symporter [Planctomycetales bacterium]|nr:sodium/solute symporter [Planctomycetales bacterium]
MLDIIVFAAFVVCVVGVGLYKSRHEKSSEDYFLAGRGLTWWLIGISLIAANISAEQFVGMSGQAADYLGIAIASYEWMAAITLVVVAIFFLPYFLRAGIFTIPEFLEHRYNHWSRLTMAVFMMVILIGVSLSGVIYAGALAMSDLLTLFGYNISLTACCWFMGLMAALYVTFGGLKACAWADLIQGTALILGGAVILWFALDKMGQTPVAELTTFSGVGVTGLSDAASGMEKLMTLNRDKLHMVLSRNDLNIPWTALVVGLWIPNFYYWGLNQYITQRVLGSASLREGQKGIVFAAALKLLIPFIIVFPGIMAFNLFSRDMADFAAKDPKMIAANAAVLTTYDMEKNNPASTTVFVFDKGWEQNNPDKAKELAAYNETVQARIQAAGKDADRQFLIGYKTDSALGLLIGKLLPRGILGFVLAAMLGAIVSSLAAVLNAASTIFTMDIYGKYFNRNASQKALVLVGRICVAVFVVVGCVVSPKLADPRFGGIFKYIQEFQGYVSPGILAVFVFGLLNRRARGISGVVALLLNPVLYYVVGKVAPQVAFLDRMAICFFVVMAVMTLIGILRPLPQPVVFTTNTRINVETSRPAVGFGIVVILATVALYILFW